ncbi:efflux RND transporter periplasmic adaptor subunit [Arenimonas sp.]|uniref:efflux RND transporter periplasmic adaptor subunit n=1 Tax=Arenimonas sp. TaxID=1872635 RepID=UPI0037BF2680
MSMKPSGRSLGKIAIVAIAVLAIWFGYRSFSDGGEASESQYRTEPAQVADLSSSISATGTLGATATVEVGTQVSGTLQTVEVDFNDQVNPGQIIARIDPSTFQARVEQAGAALASAQAGLAEARASAVNASRDFERKSQLATKQLISKTDRDIAQAQNAQAQARVQSAQAQVSQQQANLNSAQLDLAKTIIRSPVKGTVLARNVEPGQTVAASLQTPVLFKIAGDLSEMEIVLAIDEADIGQLQVGQEASFTVDAFPDRNFRGKVKQIRLAANNVSNVVTFPVVIDVNNADQVLLPGLTATAQIITSRKAQVLTVPNAALRFRPASAAANSGPSFGAPMQAAPPSMEERSKRMQGQLDAMRQFLVQSKAEPAVLASFDASAEAYKQQAARMMQRFAQGAAAGASGGAAPQGMTGGGNGARRFADRFAKAFESVRAQLSPELQRQWDQQIQALFNAKRATVYVLEKGEPVAVEIRLGVSDGSRSEVIGGLKSGQQVIVGSARSTP